MANASTRVESPIGLRGERRHIGATKRQDYESRGATPRGML
jgi:hypothetical protein